MVLMVNGGRNSRLVLEEGWYDAKLKTQSNGTLHVAGENARKVKQLNAEPAVHALAKRDDLCAKASALQGGAARLIPARETAV